MANEVVRWDPFNEMVSLRDAVSHLFEDAFIRPAGWPLPFEGAAWSTPVDVIETKDQIVVKATVPGVKPDEVDVSITGEALTIKGETKAEEKFEEGSYLRKERRFGAFQRTLTLPVNVVADKAKAEFENGVLTLTLPKTEEVKPKSIKVNLKK